VNNSEPGTQRSGEATAGRTRTREPVVVLGTIGHDAHIVGSSVLRFAFEEAGFKVVFLGAVVPPEEFISAAKELGHVKLYLGGILVTDPEQWLETEALFKSYGFDRVYPPQTKAETAISDLKKDLGLPA
jgi:methylaspartate mutase sigma subunit